MKNLYLLLFFGLFTTVLTTSIHAQQGFDTKKKNGTQVNTSSLGAVRIAGSSKNNTGRNKISPTPIVQRSQTAFPTFQQPQLKIFYSTQTGLPSFISSARNNSSSRAAIKKDISSATSDYLLELKSVLQIEKPESDFLIQRIKTDNNNKTHVRLNQHYNGVPIYGSEVIVHLNAFGEGEAFNGNYHSIKEDLDTHPDITEQFAIEKVSAHHSKGRLLRSLSPFEKKLVQYDKPKATLCIYQDKGLVNTYVLAYHVVYCPTVQERWEYFIDASTGAVLHRFESICSVDGPRTATGLDLNGISRTVNTYQGGATYFMVDISRVMYKPTGSVLPDEPIGGILTIDMNNTFGEDQAIQHSI
ncbi:MAG: hypothetical protein C0490_08275, partial [Marivirga sp.]|nr:hypothetical protein [Marivirga sp.]